jgi:hypothetical protein
VYVEAHVAGVGCVSIEEESCSSVRCGCAPYWGFFHAWGVLGTSEGMMLEAV